MEPIDIIIPTMKKMDDLRHTMVKELEEMTPEPHRIIVTGQQMSAAKNRNFGLEWARSQIIVMMDDDMTGFYRGWLTDLIYPIREDVMVCSARLINASGEKMHMMGGENNFNDEMIVPAENNRVTTACIAIQKNRVRFDEGYIGSGYEDTDYMLQIGKAYPDHKIVINNACRLIHTNEQKNQGGKYFEHNKKLFMEKWDDDAARGQKAWS